jgi:surfactin synthase thioesterase subunit/glycosyltransferase involved in cell wall biosynthesis
MRILLAQNSLYYPAHGGGDKSNRLLIEALAARGHQCRVVARIPVFGPQEHAQYLETLVARGIHATPEDGVVRFDRNCVKVTVVTNANLSAVFTSELNAFQPDIVLASTDDRAQILLQDALASNHRVVYLARATLAVPFGPDCAFPSEEKTERIRRCGAVVGVSQYVADYITKYAGIDAVHVPISLMELEDWPDLGRFENDFVTMVNPSTVKGIPIFLALADAFPNVRFAAVPMWGTTAADRTALEARPNIALLEPVDDINLLLARTRVLLVPSLWAEARSRIIMEAMLRGVPVMAAAVGGIPEAKLGVPYLLPVRPIASYEPRVDEQMVPVAHVPDQDIAPWRDALARLVQERAYWTEIATASRQAALEYAKELHAGHFEALLEDLCRRPVKVRESGVTRPSRVAALSEDKRKLLALELRKRAPSSAWFPGVAADAARRLFWFPHAGGGGAKVPGWIGVVLPGRECRLAEAPFTRMAPLITALADAIDPNLTRPFAFFGHSMGAAVAFELARELRRRGKPLPEILIASAARAPQFRRGHVPPPTPSREQFLNELRRLQGIPAEILDDPAMLRAILPALEADATLYRNYVYTEADPFPFPIRAYGGLDDPNIRREHLDAWSEQTTASFSVHQFPGGHFYPNTARQEFLAALTEDVCL